MTCAPVVVPILTAIAIALGAAVARADTIDASGEAPYERCGYCHEIDGNPRMEEFPRLAGQSASYLAKQLRDFRAGRRVSTMQAVAELLSDGDIDVVACYFSAQTPRLDGKTRVMAPAERLRAQRLYRRGDRARGIPACGGCHGAAGEGRTGPRVAMQHAAYSEKQLLAFKQGTRTNDPGGVMRAIAAAATEREIRALARYVEGLGGQ